MRRWQDYVLTHAALHAHQLNNPTMKVINCDGFVNCYKKSSAVLVFIRRGSLILSAASRIYPLAVCGGESIGEPKIISSVQRAVWRLGGGTYLRTVTRIWYLSHAFDIYHLLISRGSDNLAWFQPASVIMDGPFIVVNSIDLVSWCFEPSQPQRITLGLKTNFNLSSIIHSTNH